MQIMLQALVLAIFIRDIVNKNWIHIGAIPILGFNIMDYIATKNMSILTVTFPAQTMQSAAPELVKSMPLAMLSFGLLGVAVTLMMVWKAKKANGKNALASSLSA